MHSRPLAYFITFRTYGTWLPGDERGSTRRRPDNSGGKATRPSQPLVSHAKSVQSDESVVLNADAREAVRMTIQSVCEHRAWTLVAVNVRSNHVHIVVSGETTPEKMMNAFKSWATRRLRERDQSWRDRRVWARHGSTINLFSERQVAHAVWYTNEAQDGERFELRDA